MKQGRTVGTLVLAGGIILGVAGLGILLALAAFSGLEFAGLAVGLVVLLVIVLPVVGMGVFLLASASREAEEAVVVAQQRKLLDMVLAEGELRMSDAALELKVDTAQLKDWVYTLVGLGVFSGYINWDDGVLYSREASKLRDMTECVRCGGSVRIAGRGVSQCAHCGTEYYL